MTVHEVERFVFVDEMGSNINLYRKYGRSMKGQRVFDRIPYKRVKNQTLVGAMGLDGFKADFAFEGAMNAQIFRIYVAEVLCPSLKPDQIVIMDNLSSHKDSRIKILIEAVGCELKYLPPYSPDLSPIEHSFSKIKSYLRRIGARSKETLFEGMRDVLRTISLQDCRGWFTHCGYAH